MNRHLRAIAMLLLAGSIAIAGVEARGISDAAPASALKAAFLFNFAKFVDWPSDVGDAETIVLCVTDDTSVAEALETIVRGRTIGKRQLEVRRPRRDGALGQCQVLYVAGLNRQSARELVLRLKDAAVFSVSDFEGFAQMGGVAHFFVDASRMRFAINPAAAQRAKLRISAQVLGLAKIVKDNDAE